MLKTTCLGHQKNNISEIYWVQIPKVFSISAIKLNYRPKWYCTITAGPKVLWHNWPQAQR